MKKKALAAWHQKSIPELEGLMVKIEKELVRLRIDQGAGKLKDVHQLARKKRDLARLKTILGNKRRS
jgi:large subunit ribosomal protein L29